MDPEVKPPVGPIHILSKPYEVRMKDMTGKFGQCDLRKSRIKLNPKQSVISMKDTLLHEVIHAIDHEMGTGMAEEQVRQIATGLLEFMRRNPKVIQWLMS